MEYEGQLYGKIGNIYVPLGETTQVIDKLKVRIKELELQVESDVAKDGGRKSFLVTYLDWKDLRNSEVVTDCDSKERAKERYVKAGMEDVEVRQVILVG